jgi:uncharacterized protein YjbJ (UPF0337 family)
MNRDRIEGQWRQLKGQVHEQWGKLTNDDLDRIAGKRDQLVGTLQNKYGLARDDVERQVKEFEDGLEEMGSGGSGRDVGQQARGREGSARQPASQSSQGQPDREPRDAEPGRPARAPQRAPRPEHERDVGTHRRAP